MKSHTGPSTVLARRSRAARLPDPHFGGAKSRSGSGPLGRWLRAAGRNLLLVALGGLLGVALVGCSSSAQDSHAPSGAAASSSNDVPSSPEEKLAEQAISRIKPTVVEVINVGRGLGSGVTMTRDGYIVTNNHVVAGAHKILVALKNGKTVPATLRGYDPVDDLAVIKINAGNNLPTVTFGNSDALQVGQTVLADGNPLGIVQTVTEGIVSALHRVVAEGQHSQGRIMNAIQTSAPINPGNSGGALINLAGQLVGIPTLIAVDPAFDAPAPGVGFAIPSNRVKDIASQIIKYGKVEHSGIAELGIRAASVTPQLAQTYNLPVPYGVLIAGFTPHSPARKAGLKKGDIILDIGPTDINSEEALLTVLAHKKPGDTVTVTAVKLHGTKHTYKVTLDELNVYANG